jgi:hypothetical protein
MADYFALLFVDIQNLPTVFGERHADARSSSPRAGTP